MKFKLIDEWKQAWKFLTTHVNVIMGSSLLAYAEYYDKLKDTVPPELMAVITGVVFLLNIILRVVNQSSVKKD